MENILVTGAAGFIGMRLVNELIAHNHKVYALIQKEDIIGRDKLKAIDSSIEILDDLEEMFNNIDSYPIFDKIFHLAAVGVTSKAININLICDVNIKMGCQLVDFAKKNNSKLFINFGSCFEYGDHGDILLKEYMNCVPESLYAISKNASTNLITAYAKSQSIKLITVRPFGVFGEGENLARLAPSIINNCLKKQDVKTTLGEQIRDFVNVKDLVRAIINLSEANCEPFEIYNICSNKPISVRDFILEIVDVCGLDVSLIKFGSIPYRENEAMVFAGDNSKLQELINYPFPDDHREGIIDIYNSIINEDYNNGI